MRSREINLSQAIQRVERARRERESARAAKEAKLAKSAMKIIVGDNIEEMGQMVKGSVDLCFIDPPYNNGWKYDGDITKDDLPEGEYLDQMQRTFNAVVPLLSRKASLFVLIDDNYSDHFGILLRRSGLHRRNTIVWWETFGVHQRGNFSNCARYLHYYTARPNGFVWHPELIESARQRTKDPRANPNGKVPDNIWQIPRVVGSDRDRVPFEDAPPQVPVELPLRCILAAADPGDLVLDCFHGNGTTGLAAMQAGRKYIGIERSAKYARQSEQWMKSQLSVTPDARPGGGREAK
jgi:DNA modification methylase